LFLCLLVAASVCLSTIRARDAEQWKYRRLTIVVQTSGAHRPHALALIELLNRLANIKPADVSVEMFGFEEGFRHAAEGRFKRKPALLLSETRDREALREAAGDLVFSGPSPVYDALTEALSAAAQGREAAVLLVSNGIDNASGSPFDEVARRVEKASIPIIAFYFPTNPPQGGDSRLRKLARVSGGCFIDVRARDSWDRLLSALR